MELRAFMPVVIFVLLSCRSPLMFARSLVTRAMSETLLLFFVGADVSDN